MNDKTNQSPSAEAVASRDEIIEECRLLVVSAIATSPELVQEWLYGVENAISALKERAAEERGDVPEKRLIADQAGGKPACGRCSRRSVSHTGGNEHGMLAAQLRGIVDHLRSVPAYEKLRGDADIIERAMHVLHALPSTAECTPIPYFTDRVYAAYKGALKAYIEAVPPAERAQRWKKNGHGWVIPDREKAEIRFHAMMIELEKEQGRHVAPSSKERGKTMMTCPDCGWRAAVPDGWLTPSATTMPSKHIGVERGYDYLGGNKNAPWVKVLFLHDDWTSRDAFAASLPVASTRSEIK